MALRDGHTDEFSGRRSFRYGPSTSNTVRINAGGHVLIITADLYAEDRESMV